MFQTLPRLLKITLPNFRSRRGCHWGKRRESGWHRRPAVTQCVYTGVSSGASVCHLQRARSPHAWRHSHFTVAWFSEIVVE